MFEIKIISDEKASELVDAWCEEEERVNGCYPGMPPVIPKECWICHDNDGGWTAIDNSDNMCWVEGFDTEGMAICYIVGWCNSDGTQAESNREPYMTATAIDLIDEAGKRIDDVVVQTLLDEALTTIYSENQ